MAVRWGPPLTRLATVGCFAAVALLAVGVDLSPLARVAPILTVEPGDAVTLDVVGRLDNGSVFLEDHALGATLGSGGLVAGLEQAIEGLAVGHAFQANVTPSEGYGVEDPRLVTPVARSENESRTFQVARAQFEGAVGPPYRGEVVQTQPWASTVVSTGDPVGLSYNAVPGTTVRIYRYWESRITSVTNQSITWENLLQRGDQFELATRPGTPGKLVRAVSENATTVTLDSNPPLAGQTLHFRGRLLAIRPGTGVRRLSGMASSLSSLSCESCHGGAGFNAMSAEASATQSAGGVLVNITLTDPWQHDVHGIGVTARMANLTAVNVASPDLGPQASKTMQFTVPGNATGSVDLTVNATAHHVHRSGGKPDDLPYQLRLRVPIGGPRKASTAGVRSPWVGFFDEAGSLTGFAALGLLLVPAVQGYRRRLGRRPVLRLPPWLTTHVAVSLVVVLVTFAHAVTIMSGTWHGNWGWGVVLGAAAMVGLGLMGMTGLAMAGWTRGRWPRLKRTHFSLMVAILVLSLLHAWVVGTHFAFLR